MDEEFDIATDLEYFGCFVLILVCAGVVWAIT